MNPFLRPVCATLVCLAAAAPSYGQVTVYGAINATVEMVKADPGIRKTTKLSDSASFIGFRGVEDLGDGLSAYFVLQTLFDISGASSPLAVNSNGFSDQAFVGLRGKFGSIQAGYFPVHNPAGILRWDGAAVYMGQASLLLPLVHGNGQTFGSTAGGRMRNMLQYSTPTMGGAQASVFFGRPDETLLATGEQGKAVGFTGSYSTGPWFALYSYIRQINTNTLFAVDGFEVTGHRLVGAYNQASGWNAALVLDWQKNSDPLLGAGLKRTTVGLPVWYRQGSHTVAATYARASDVSGIRDSGASFAMLGYSYALSKRTNVYVNVARISNEANARYDYQTNAQIGGVGGPPNFRLLMPAGSDPQTVQVGIRHSF